MFFSEICLTDYDHEYEYDYVYNYDLPMGQIHIFSFGGVIKLKVTKKTPEKTILIFFLEF